MKLLFIFTGGTIGSTLQDGYISTDSNKPYRLIEEYKRRYGLSHEYDILQPYTELSENNTGDTIKALCRCLKENVQKNYDGIILTHGTDTLQYSAAAISYVLGSECIPVCIVSSNLPIEDKNANGIDNLHAAVKFIEESGSKGVWVLYKNPGDRVKAHRGTRLIPSQPYSDCFYSIDNSYFGEYDSDFKFYPNEGYSEKSDETDPLPYWGLKESCQTILRIEPYPGMVYPRLTDEVKYIIHGSFHSGTINTVSLQAKRFFEDAKEKDITVYLTGASSGDTYESTKLFEKFNIIPLPKASPIAMYIKLWLCVSSEQDVISIMTKSISGDILA